MSDGSVKLLYQVFRWTWWLRKVLLAFKILDGIVGLVVVMGCVRVVYGNTLGG